MLFILGLELGHFLIRSVSRFDEERDVFRELDTILKCGEEGWTISLRKGCAKLRFV